MPVLSPLLPMVSVVALNTEPNDVQPVRFGISVVMMGMEAMRRWLYAAFRTMLRLNDVFAFEGVAQCCSSLNETRISETVPVNCVASCPPLCVGQRLSGHPPLLIHAAICTSLRRLLPGQIFLALACLAIGLQPITLFRGLPKVGCRLNDFASRATFGSMLRHACPPGRGQVFEPGRPFRPGSPYCRATEA